MIPEFVGKNQRKLVERPRIRSPENNLEDLESECGNENAGEF